MRKPSRRLLLITAVSSLLVSGFLITSFAGFFVSRASLRNEIKADQLPVTSDSIHLEIKNDLLKPILISAMMAQDTFVRAWVLNGEKDSDLMANYLKSIQTRFKTFTAFFVSEKTGNYYYPGGILKKVSPDAERDIWYYRVRNLPTDYEINIDPDLAHKDAMTVFINYRVFGFNGEYIGTAGVGLNQSFVSRLIDQYQTKYNRTIYIVDRNGDVMLNGTLGEPADHDTQLFLEEPGVRNALTGKGETALTIRRTHQTVHINIRYIEEFDWFLVVEQPENAAVGPVFKTLLLNLGICICITVITLILVNLSVTVYEKRIETLRGIVPICSYCHQIRDDKGFWNRVDAYVEKHTEARFSHSICPSCLETHFPEEKQDG